MPAGRESSERESHCKTILICNLSCNLDLFMGRLARRVGQLLEPERRCFMPIQRNALAALATRPRVRLAPLPTPLQRARRLGDALGVELWIKRDDIGSLGLAGNKVRKLEFALGAALADGADCVVTCGAAQSNHMRATAAAAAQLGLRAILVVRGEQDDLPPTGNLLLDRLLGAELRWSGTEDWSKLNQLVDDVAQ